MSPWWNETVGTYIGAFGGAGIGTVGGIYGAVAGTLAQQGKARGAVLGFHLGLLTLGAVTLIAGVVALLVSQPYHVYYPLLLIGGITSGVMGGLLPVMRKRYREAEHRHLEAEEIRRDS
jgi:hypothetical protein